MIIWSLVLLLCSCSFNDKEEKKEIVNNKSNIISSKKAEEKNNKVKKVLLEKKLELNKLKNLDFKTDSSITKYVDNKISFNKKDYIPENLVDLKWDYLIDVKWNQKIRKITLENLDKLSKDFYNTFNKKLKIVSAYRSYIYQKWIKDRGCSDKFCAKAGYSEHQSGLAVDFWEASEKERFKKNNELKHYFKWMKDNWYKYWFENSYKNWVEIDWYVIEPWHWRYVWVELATYLHKQKITFAQFYYKNNIK